jgi:hypothetical protein
VWRFGQTAPEVVGDVLVASRAGGELFAQFTKAHVTVAVARATPNRWELDLALFDRRLAGRGEPDERFALFQLARSIASGMVAEPWTFQSEDDGRWRLEHPTTGEFMEGYWER